MSHPLAEGLEYAPAPFAVTSGATHVLVYANRSFRRLVDAPELDPGIPLCDILVPEATLRLGQLLDRALADGVGMHDQFLGRLKTGTASWHCSIWPIIQTGRGPEGLTIELRMATHVEQNEALQREVAERLLLSALREVELGEVAEASRERLAYLIDAGRRLGGSLEEVATRETVAGIALPSLGAWCIVDLIEQDSTVTRLAMIHPNPEKQALLRELAKDWAPRPGDPFGAPAVMGNAQPVVTRVEMCEVSEALEAAAHNPENLRLLSEIGVGPLLTVPLISHGKLLGAVTFVSARTDREYTPDDVELAEGLAFRSAEALSSARLYGTAVTLRERADESSHSRMRFLGNISHELRTPLNAIMGYAQLMQEEVHGPITPEQRHDLGRIRLNQEHLLVLITDILNFVRAGLTPITASVPVSLAAAAESAFAMLEPLAAKKEIRLLNEVADPDLLAAADPDRVQQILINLISNAIKFTPWEGTITVRAEGTKDSVQVTVVDTGIGIPPKKMQAIFEPFVQVDKGDVTGASGVGLGLAISRDLARAMQGNLTVESIQGEGSSFILTLPRCS